MSKILFSSEQIDKLSKNKYVLKVSEKAITYTNEFKIHFIAEYNNGKTSRVIFEEAGLDVDTIGIWLTDSYYQYYSINYIITFIFNYYVIRFWIILIFIEFKYK